MILTTISLDEIKFSPSSTFYKLLKPYHKSVYESQERIVLENFGEISKELLHNVVQILQQLDISPFFITVKTNQPGTQDFFQALAEPIRVESVQGSPKLPLGSTRPMFNVNGKMCAHAWSGFHVDTDGRLRVCCEFGDWIKDDQGQPLNIRSHSVNEIVDSNYMIKLRQQFRSGITPAACSKCEFYEKHHGTSKRSLSRFKLSNLYNQIDWEDDHVADRDLFIGGHLGNTCNLKCRICNEKFSSQIAVEKIKSDRGINDQGLMLKEDLVERNWKLTDPYFWQRLRELGSRACNFEFLGGEPLLLQENLDFMEHLVESGHSENCIFEFITNGTQYPKIFDRINRFQRLTITVSIDDLGPRFEYQRKNSNWQMVQDNLARFVRTRDNNKDHMEIGVSVTVNIQNVLYLPQLISWLRSQNIDHYFINILFWPRYLSIDQLTPLAKQLVLDRLATADLLPEDMAKLQPLIEAVKSSPTGDGHEFRRYMQDLDALRKENFADHHKEIAIAMGFVLE